MRNVRLFHAPFTILVVSGVLISFAPFIHASDTAISWPEAKEIHYQITGVYEGRFLIGPSADAQFTDRVEIEFVTNADSELQGEVTILNFDSIMSDPQPQPAGCRAPEFMGNLEFYTAKAFECLTCNAEMAPYAELPEDGIDRRIMVPSAVLTAERVFPAMVVGTVCTGSLSKPARKDDLGDMFRVPGAGEFMMAPKQAHSDAETLRPGASVIVEKDGNWTWTYQGTPVGGK